MFYMQGLLLTCPCHFSDRRPSQGASPGRIQTLGPHSLAPKALLWPRHHVQSHFSFWFPNIPYILLLYSLEFVISLLTKFSIVANYSWQRCSCYENPLLFYFQLFQKWKYDYLEQHSSTTFLESNKKIIALVKTVNSSQWLTPCEQSK